MVLKESPTVLYHGSTIGNLKIIKPTISTHNKPYVYATPLIGIAVGYLGRWNDFDIGTGTFNSVPYIVERYPNAMKKIFRNTGYIYTVDPHGFTNKMQMDGKIQLTGFELVNSHPVKVISMEVIENPYQYILNLRDSDLTVYLYPDRPSFIPEDDHDLIDKANILYSQFHDDGIYRELYSKHPKLLRNKM